VDGKNIIALIKQGNLTVLNLSGSCKNIPADIVSQFYNHKLVDLNLSGCLNVTDDCLMTLKNNKLKILNLSGCNSLTLNCLAHFVKMPNLLTLYLPNKEFNLTKLKEDFQVANKHSISPILSD